MEEKIANSSVCLSTTEPMMESEDAHRVGIPKSGPTGVLTCTPGTCQGKCAPNAVRYKCRAGFGLRFQLGTQWLIVCFQHSTSAPVPNGRDQFADVILCHDHREK